MMGFLIGAAFIVAAYAVLSAAIAATYVIGIILSRPVKPKKHRHRERSKL